MRRLPNLKKALGQHLLLSPGVLERITEYLELSTQEVVVEIGPGTGNLTEVLLRKVPKRLYLLEIDQEMIAYLNQRFAEGLAQGKIKILKTDAGSFSYSSIPEPTLKVVGNLPYNRASSIVERVVSHHPKVSLAVFMVQKEMAERWLGQASWLAIFIQTFYAVEYLMTIPPRFFKPRPKVDSALIRLRPRPKANLKDLLGYKGFLLNIFAQKRKCLRKKLPLELLRKGGVQPLARPEDLGLDKILNLYRLLEETNHL